MERPTAWKGRLAHLGQRKWEARPESPAWDKMEQPAAARIYVHPEPEPEPEQHVGSVRGGGPQPAALLGGEVEVSVRTGSNSARAETELDQAREELAIIEEEGREIVEHVHRLEGDVRSAQAALEAERQISEGLRAQLGEREQHSARAYNAHAATIAQNTHMQRELKKLEGEVGVARSAADVEARQKEELERELDREREAANSLLQQMEALEHESSELEALILQRSREKEAEQNASRKLLADLARLQPSAVRGGAGSDGGADGGILRQVAQLEADNAQLMRELSQLQAQAAKQADIHAAVGEMTLGPQRLVAANESLSAELGRVQRDNERRQARALSQAGVHPHASRTYQPRAAAGGGAPPQIRGGAGGSSAVTSGSYDI